MEPETANTIVALSALATAAATGFIAYFTHVSRKLTAQIAWFTGAMESHSQAQLMLEAKRADVIATWWDPTLQATPGKPKHGDQVNVSQIYFNLPRELRAGPEKIRR